MRRRRLLGGALGLLAAACYGPPPPRPAFSSPDRVDVVVHSEPGGGVDLDAREWIRLLDGEGLLEQQWRVDNRSGGAGTRAMGHLASLGGRDDVIAVMSLTWLVTPLTTREATITIRDLTPIATIVDEPTVAVVRADSPYRTLGDLLADATSRPGALSQVGGQVSSAHNVYREIIQEKTGARWNFVPLATRGERTAALLSGHAHLLFTEPSDAFGLARAEVVRVIAAVGPKRIPTFPDVPSLPELGVAVDLPTQRRGLIGPPAMRPEAVAYYADLFRRLTSSARWTEYVHRLALTPELLTGDELASALEAEEETLLAVFRRLGIAAR